MGFNFPLTLQTVYSFKYSNFDILLHLINDCLDPFDCESDPCHLAWLIRDNSQLFPYLLYTGQCSTVRFSTSSIPVHSVIAFYYKVNLLLFEQNQYIEFRTEIGLYHSLVIL